MTRSEARENTFTLLFEQEFKQPLEEILFLAEESRELKLNEFSKVLLNGVNEHLEEIDCTFEKHLKNWKKSRLSKTAISILRLATYEMKYLPEIPISVSINEAVELAKKYSGEEEGALINGILGSVAVEIDCE